MDLVKTNYQLLGGDWNMNFVFPETVGHVIIPTDELLFFRGVG